MSSIRLLWFAILMVCLSAAPVAAEPGVTPEDNGLIAVVEVVVPSEASPPKQRPVSSVEAPPSCLDQVDAPDCIPGTVCVADPASPLGGFYWSASRGIRAMMGACDPAEPAPAPVAAQVTPGRVLQAFRRIPLPESRLVVQPPGGRTLVNFDTLFRTEAEPFTRTVNLLGQRVELDIRPASFTWHHGDGTEQTTREPGLPYERGRPMREYVSHQYVDAEVTVRPSVDTTWTARFRVNGGPWQDVNGTVVMTGAPGTLEVVEARPVLTGTD